MKKSQQARPCELLRQDDGIRAGQEEKAYFMIGLSFASVCVDPVAAPEVVADDLRRNSKRVKRARAGLKRLCSSLLGLCILGPVASQAAEIHTLDLKTRVVTATAYNSVEHQTDDTPTLTAWGYELTPGMKVIAVSHDLIKRGLAHGAWVLIEGFPGVFRVLDKMAARWSNRIDIYMGRDITAARKWGRRRVRIWWEEYSKKGLAKIKLKIKQRAEKFLEEAVRRGQKEVAER
jgi:3D (Asp-Asp-Asp) domain-containing protein